MCRVIAVIFLAVLFPLQVNAASFGGFNSGFQTDYVIPRAPEKKTPEEIEQQKLAEQLAVQAPKPAAVDKSPTNWWLWGGVGLAVLVGSALAFSGGGGGGGSSSNPPASTNNSGVNVTW
jgi:hypothetical protein